MGLRSGSAGLQGIRSSGLGLGTGLGILSPQSKGAWLPTQISGCQLWLRASLGITLNGSTVSAWADQSGHGRSLTQSTPADQPLFVASAVNGQPSVRFDGVAQYMTSGAFTLAQPFTYWMVLKQITGGTSAIISSDASSSEFCAVETGASAPNVLMYSGSAAATNGTLPVGSYGLVQAIFDGASSSLTVGAHTATTGNPGANGFANGLSLGADPSPRFYSNVEIAEFILYDHHLSGGEQSSVLAGLTALYGAGA